MTSSVPPAPELVVEQGLELLAAQGRTDPDTAWDLLEDLTVKTGRSVDELSHLVVIDQLSYADLMRVA